MIAISYFHAESSVKEQKDVYEEMEKENNLSGYDDAVGVYDSDRENYARYGGECRTGKKSEGCLHKRCHKDILEKGKRSDFLSGISRCTRKKLCKNQNDKEYLLYGYEKRRVLL